MCLAPLLTEPRRSRADGTPLIGSPALSHPSAREHPVVQRGRAREHSACLAAVWQHIRVKNDPGLAIRSLTHLRKFVFLQPFHTYPTISAQFSNSAALRSSFDKLVRPPQTDPSVRASLLLRDDCPVAPAQLPAKVSAPALNLPFLPNPAPSVSSFSHTLIARRFPTSLSLVSHSVSPHLARFSCFLLHHHFLRFCLCIQLLEA